MISLLEQNKAGSIDQIAGYAGSKEEIYAEVLEEHVLPVMETLIAETNIPNLSSTERLRLYAETIAALQHQHPVWVQFLNNELIYPTTSGQAIVQKYVAHSLQFIGTVLDGGILAGEFKSDLSKKYVEMLWYALCHLDINNQLFRFPKEMAKSDVTQAFDLVLTGIAVKRRDSDK